MDTNHLLLNGLISSLSGFIVAFFTFVLKTPKFYDKLDVIFIIILAIFALIAIVCLNNVIKKDKKIKRLKNRDIQAQKTQYDIIIKGEKNEEAYHCIVSSKY